MIETIKVTNHRGETLTINLRSPWKSGMIIKEVDGLGPPKTAVMMNVMAGVDGGKFNFSRAQSRTLVLRIEFVRTPKYPASGLIRTTIEEARLNTYKYFAHKQKVKMEVISENRSVFIEGYVESNQPDIFSKNSGAVISILCPGAYFIDTRQGFVIFGYIESVFEFPWSNESTVSKLLIISTYNTETRKAFWYDGEEPVGILIRITATGSASGITITNDLTGEELSIDTTKLIAIVGSDIGLGDVIEIATYRGNKYAKMTKAGTEYDILNALGENPDWFTIEPGNNSFIYTADSGGINLEFEFLFDVVYTGV